MKNLEVLLGLLDTWRGHYTIDTRGKDALVVHAEVPTVPGERWEIRLFIDGRIEAEVFKSVAIESGDRIDHVFLKLREHPELAPPDNFVCHVPESDEAKAARAQGMAEALQRASDFFVS
jgi:hypothetical protein